MLLKRTQMTAKFIDDFRGYASKYDNKDWDVFDNMFSEYLSAIGLIMDNMKVPEDVPENKKGVYRDRQVQSAINYLSAVMNTAYNGHNISFNDSYLAPSLQGNQSTFAKALECMLIQKDMTIIPRRMKDLNEGVLNRAPVDNCSGKTEFALITDAINKMNKLAYEDDKQFPTPTVFRPEEYINRLNVSTR